MTSLFGKERTKADRLHAFAREQGHSFSDPAQEFALDHRSLVYRYVYRMLKMPLLQPDILRALAGAGHGAKVLVADGNYPVSTGTPDSATRVYLNLCPGCVTVMEVLAVLRRVIPVEAALVMLPRNGPVPEVHREIRDELGAGVPMNGRSREEFYAAARHSDTALVIATGEQRRFANVLLTIGTVRHADDRDTPAAEPLRPAEALPTA